MEDAKTAKDAMELIDQALNALGEYGNGISDSAIREADSKLMKARNNRCSVASRFAFFVIIGCFVQASGEASLFLGGFPSITYIFLFYVLMNSKSSVTQ